jgi:calcineurin-like phosphoesterase family protein
MVRRWNEAVGEDDLVVHLGDFALASRSRIAELAGRLNGRKIIVLGNHDRSATAMRSCGFVEAVREYEVGGLRCVHDPAGARPGEVTLAGHVHDAWAELRRPDEARVINVGVDVRGFRPVALAELLGNRG